MEKARYSSEELAKVNFEPSTFEKVLNWKTRLDKVYAPHDDSYQLLFTLIKDLERIPLPATIFEAGLYKKSWFRFCHW